MRRRRTRRGYRKHERVTLREKARRKHDLRFCEQLLRKRFGTKAADAILNPKRKARKLSPPRGWHREGNEFVKD